MITTKRAGRFWPWLLLLVPGLFGCADDVQPIAASGRVQRALADVAGSDGIEIATFGRSAVSTRYGRIQGQAATADEIDRYADLFIPEFSLYPPSLIRQSGLVRVVLCKDLSFDGQLRGAIPDFEHETLYLDVLRGGYSRLYLREILHHEFFHIIDYGDDGSVYEDAQWAALNPPGFKYGTGGKDAQQRADAGVLTDKYPGFLNYYSTTGVEEDKAELFANMIVNSQYVSRRAKTDRVLRAKVQTLRRMLADFCPEIDESFWARAAELRRTEK